MTFGTISYSMRFLLQTRQYFPVIKVQNHITPTTIKKC